MYTEPDCLSEIFCDYFAGVADKIVCENFGTSKPSICTSPNMVPSTFFFMPVTKHDVLLVISQLKNGKSTGVDGISAKLIKYIADDVSEYLAELFNLSVRQGRFPDILKTGIITPVFKKGDPLDIVNYRPIALLSVFSKIFEKLAYSRMNDFLERYNLVTDSQHGFRRGRSTQSAAWGSI